MAQGQDGAAEGLAPGFRPKALIAELAEGLLDHYKGRPLIDAYDVYQHLMDYWVETMQDDVYLIADGGWKAETYRVIERKRDKNGKETTKDKGWGCRPGAQGRSSSRATSPGGGEDRGQGKPSRSAWRPGLPRWKKNTAVRMGFFPS